MVFNLVKNVDLESNIRSRYREVGGIVWGKIREGWGRIYSCFTKVLNACEVWNGHC